MSPLITSPLESNTCIPRSSGAKNRSFDCPNMVANVSLWPGSAVKLNSNALPGVAGPGIASPAGMRNVPLATMPRWCWTAPASAGLPSSASASRPLPRSFAPAVKSGSGSVCTTHSPGAFGAGAVWPFESFSVAAVETFSIRTVNVVRRAGPV